MIDEPNNVQAAIDAGRALGAPINLDPKNPGSALQLVVLPPEHTAIALEPLIEKFLDAPRRIKAHPHLATADSFIEYVALFKYDGTKVFAIIPPGNQAPSFLAIIDYHTAEGASWTDHKAAYLCQFTEEWKRWMAFDRKRMSQVEFATLLEENQALVTTPPGAELLELIQTLEGKSAITCNQLIKLNNGRTKLLYDEDVELKGTVSTQPGQAEFPTSLTVAIPPFDGGPTYKVTCRLKYRIENRKIVLWFEAIDVHLIIKECVVDVVAKVEKELETKVLFGQP